MSVSDKLNLANARASARLYFLDWVRILAFFLLIAFHVGMYYVSWGWHIKSLDAGSALEPLMRLSSPWRLGLLFLISGVASSFMLQKKRPGNFARERSVRLLPPLLFGMLVIVPPQAYYEVVEKLAYSGSYLDFMQLYLQRYRGFTIDGQRLILPTWNHLWFVAYLWVYSMLLCLFVQLAPAWFAGLRLRFIRLLQGWGMLFFPIAYLAVIRVLMLTPFPSTNNLVWDWFNHATYLFLFFAGVFLADAGEFWQQVSVVRRRSLRLAAACWVLLTVYYGWFVEGPQWLLYVQRVVWVTMAWNAILAACGFAYVHLNFDHATRRYLTQAVFPVYILHQTIIVVLAHNLKIFKIPAPAEALLLIAATVALSFAGFELIRRTAILRPLFGLPMHAQYPRISSTAASVPSR